MIANFKLDKKLGNFLFVKPPTTLSKCMNYILFIIFLCLEEAPTTLDKVVDLPTCWYLGSISMYGNLSKAKISLVSRSPRLNSNF